MERIVEVDDEGRLIIPQSVIGDVKPHTQYRVEAEGSELRVVPVAEKPRRTKKEAEAWVKAFLEWASEPKPPVPDLPDEAFRRESIYD